MGRPRQIGKDTLYRMVEPSRQDAGFWHHRDGIVIKYVWGWIRAAYCTVERVMNTMEWNLICLVCVCVCVVDCQCLSQQQKKRIWCFVSTFFLFVPFVVGVFRTIDFYDDTFFVLASLTTYWNMQNTTLTSISDEYHFRQIVKMVLSLEDKLADWIISTPAGINGGKQNTNVPTHAAVMNFTAHRQISPCGELSEPIPSRDNLCWVCGVCVRGG